MISVAEFLRNLRVDQTTELSFDGVDFPNATEGEIQELAKFIKENKERKSVNFCFVNMASIDLNKIKPVFLAIRENFNITDLSLSRCGMEKANKEVLNLLQSSMANLETLDLSNNSMTTSTHAIQFLIDLTKSNVKKLNCSFIRLEECEFPIAEKIVMALVANQNLRSLDLGYFDLKGNSSEDLKKYCDLVAIILNGKTELKSKVEHISFCRGSFGLKLTLQHWEMILKAIAAAEQLKTLDLSSCALGLLDLKARVKTESENPDAEAFIQMFGEFLQSTTLEEIDISDNDFDKETTINLLQFAMQNPKLKLKIKGNGLTDKEIEEVEEIIRADLKENQDIPSETAATGTDATSIVATPLLASSSSLPVATMLKVPAETVMLTAYKAKAAAPKPSITEGAVAAAVAFPKPCPSYCSSTNNYKNGMTNVRQ